MDTWRGVLLASGLTLAANSASAGMEGNETFYWEFEVLIDTGPLTGNTYFGDLSYTFQGVDPGPEPDRGGESPPLDHLNFAFDGLTFNESHDVGFPDTPLAHVKGGGAILLGIRHLVIYTRDLRGMLVSNYSFGLTRFDYDLDIHDDQEPGAPTDGTGTVTYRLIPAPGATAMFGLLALGAARRRR